MELRHGCLRIREEAHLPAQHRQHRTQRGVGNATGVALLQALAHLAGQKPVGVGQPEQPGAVRQERVRSHEGLLGLVQRVPVGVVQPQVHEVL